MAKKRKSIIKFSLRKLLSFVLVVGLGFGIAELWKSNKRNQTDKLLAYVANQKLKSVQDFEFKTVVFAIGTPGNFRWPDSERLKKLGLSNFEAGPVDSTDGNARNTGIFYVDTPRWTGWSSANLTYGFVHQGHYTYFADVPFEISDGEWLSNHKGRASFMPIDGIGDCL